MTTHESPSIRWLHISDIHIQDPRGPGRQGDQKDVLNAFLKFCRDNMPNQWGFMPDYIFITGDLAYTGKGKIKKLGDRMIKSRATKRS